MAGGGKGRGGRGSAHDGFLSTVDEGEADEGDGYLPRVATAKAVGRACPPLFCPVRVFGLRLAHVWPWMEPWRSGSRTRVVRQDRAVCGEPWSMEWNYRDKSACIQRVPAAELGLIDLSIRVDASRRLVEMCLM